MKKLFCLLALQVVSLNAQTVTVNYTPSSEIFSNPERGFYKHEETHATSYDLLNQTTLTNYRLNNKISLILRLFYLDAFIAGPISAGYLQNMQTDFSKIRAAGLKCVVRFAYSDQYNPNVSQDATKTQILAHIAQLKPILLANADVIAVAQAGFIGTWGEWYYTTNFGINPSASDFVNRREVVEALLQALPAKRFVQIRTPKLKRGLFNVADPLTSAQAFQNTSIARSGHHNDCFLASSNDEGTYGSIAVDYPYLEQETLYTPMGGESCAVNEPRSGCNTALLELEKFHWSYINLDYHPGVISGWQNNNCFSEIESRLGYRLEMRYGIYPQYATAGGSFPITLTIQNSGFAAPFNERTAYLVLRNTASSAEYKIALNNNPQLWAGGALTTINEIVTLPAGISGSFKLFLSLPDADNGLAGRPEYAIRMANQNTWEATTGYNNLNHTLTVTGALGVSDVDESSSDLVLYPVPSSDHVTVAFPDISNLKLQLYNMLGQQIQFDIVAQTTNTVQVNTASLPSGMYFISVFNGSQKQTKQFIVRH